MRSLDNSSSKIFNYEFQKTCKVPTSKSFANRALVLAALAKKAVTVRSISDSTDVERMLNCFKKIGLFVTRDGEDITIHNSFPECEKNFTKPLILETGDGGTTNRFLVGLLSLGSREYILKPHGHMNKRPMDEFVLPLKHLGVQVESNDEKWFSVKGPIQDRKEEIEVDCEKSTQFATAMTLAFFGKELKVKPLNLKTSKMYYEMTLSLVHDFESGKVDFENPVDGSSLSYPLALAAVGGEVLVVNCKKRDPYQADFKLIDVIEEQGIPVNLDPEKGLYVNGQGHELNGFEVDCSDCPDLAPTLAFVAANAKGTSVLKNIKVLRFKECDRVEEVMRTLKTFGIKVDLVENGSEEDLVIHGGELQKVTEFTPVDDHRMVMIAYLFLRKSGGGVLHNITPVAKSFPRFIDEMK